MGDSVGDRQSVGSRVAWLWTSVFALVDRVVRELVTSVVRIYRLRRAFASAILWLPAPLRSGPFRIHTTHESEYAGVWRVTPRAARRRLREIGFEPLLWSELQGYEREGDCVLECGSFVYHPEGPTGRWQLHVRLFETPGGAVEVWPHWELNGFYAPRKHVAGVGRDPDRGADRLEEWLGSAFDRDAPSSRTGPVR